MKLTTTSALLLAAMFAAFSCDTVVDKSALEQRRREAGNRIDEDRVQQAKSAGYIPPPAMASYSFRTPRYAAYYGPDWRPNRFGGGGACWP